MTFFCFDIHAFLITGLPPLSPPDYFSSLSYPCHELLIANTSALTDLIRLFFPLSTLFLLGARTFSEMSFVSIEIRLIPNPFRSMDPAFSIVGAGWPPGKESYSFLFGCVLTFSLFFYTESFSV